MIKKNEKLIKLFDNKKVVLVGPGGILEGHGLGAYIDSFDIVVRVNNLPYPQELQQDLGNRTDVYYNGHFPWEKQMYEKQQLEDEEFMKKEGKPLSEEQKLEALKTCVDTYNNHKVKHYIFTIPQSSDISEPFQDMINTLDENSEFEVHYAGSENFNLCYEEEYKVGRPNSGFCAILDLLHYPFKKLEIVGVDFHRSSYQQNHRHGALDFYNFVKEDLEENEEKHDLHYPDRQFHCFKKNILEKDKRVSSFDCAQHYFVNNEYDHLYDFKIFEEQGRIEELNNIKKSIESMPKFTTYTRESAYV